VKFRDPGADGAVDIGLSIEVRHWLSPANRFG
jgi:hypothetical protein